MKKDSTIFVAGGHGLVGSAIVRRLQETGYTNVHAPGRSEVDLSDENQVRAFFSDIKPDYVLIAAAKVGGILANDTQPVEFLLENMKIQNALIPLAYEYGVKKLLFLGSSCIYPKFCEQPIKESALLTGPLEPTNEAYAIAKIAGIKLCQAYRKEYGFDAICAQPTNLYGPNDNFSSTGSHVIPALLRRIVEAKDAGLESITCWGTGTPTREFLYVDDLADACIHLMGCYSEEGIVNVGTGHEISIADLTMLICDKVGWNGKVEWDSSKPDGTPRKVCDVSLLKSQGWEPKVTLERGIELTLEWFRQHQAEIRK